MAIHSPTLIPTSCVTQHTARWERDTWGCAQSTFVWVDGTVYAGAGTTEVSDASLWWDGGKTKVWTEVGCIPHTLRHSANTGDSRVGVLPPPYYHALPMKLVINSEGLSETTVKYSKNR